MVEYVLAKDETGVRFSLPAPSNEKHSPKGCFSLHDGAGKEVLRSTSVGESKGFALFAKDSHPE